MNLKPGKGWLKHADFIILDILCLQLSFVLAHWLIMGVRNPYEVYSYRYLAAILFFAQVVVTLFGYNYKMELMPAYYSSAEEEQYVDREVEKILEELSARNLPEEERVRAVHDYVVQLLSYDSVHKANKQNHGKTTAYYALRYHQAVCQGYAVLCYRLLKELGVECRIVTGILVPEGTEEGTAERHAWLMVTVNGEDLYMDPTLDDVNSSYDWYLKSAEDFDKDHIREKKGTQ